MIEKNELDSIVQKIVEIVPAKEIILFGSYAKNEERKDSDIDLCILVEDEKIEKRKLITNIRTALFDSDNYKHPIDILIYSVNDFLEKSNFKFAFENEIKRTGVKIYG